MLKCLNVKMLKCQRGVSLYLAIMVMIILLAVALGLSSIFIGQSRIIKEMGNSVIAFYAADAGIEKILRNRDNPSDISEITLDNGATYQVFVTEAGVGDCTADNFCIKSVGKYKKTRRAIEVTY